MSFPPSLQYIFIHCGTNNIGHNDPEVISDGLINLARDIKKKYKDVKIIISSLLPRDKANSQFTFPCHCYKYLFKRSM